MNKDKFYKWLFESKTKDREKQIEQGFNFFILVGPPAAGKSSWIEDEIEKPGLTYIQISRDNIIESDIFPKYGLSNLDLFETVPPKNAKLGEIVPGFEKFGEVVNDNLGRKAFKKIVDVNNEIDQIVNKEIISGFKQKTPNIIIDGTNSIPMVRKKYLDIARRHPEYKRIAVYFQFEGYEQEIKARAKKRAERLRADFGEKFSRDITDKGFSDMLARIVKPHESEGFDEVTSYDSFKGVKTATMKPTAESLTLGFRKFLNEEVNENNFGVVKTGSGLNVNYVLIDTKALISFYKSLDPQNPDITKKDLIDNNIVVSAVKIAENTEELKAAYGTCMDASQVKVAAVNKNLARKGYGRLLYKIIMSEHPEGLYPDRDDVSAKAKDSWEKLAKIAATKIIKSGGKTYNSFDDFNNSKTPPLEDDCVIHIGDDSEALNKAYTYSGENTDFYLMKAHEALSDCEEMIAGGWTVESLEDLIVDAGMTLYDLSIGIESLEEARLSKIFRRKAKQKAKRKEEKYGYKHRKWAEKQQKRWNTEHPELEELYLKEIEAATAASKAVQEYLSKMKDIRKKRLEEREKAKLGHPQEKVKYNKSRKPEKPPKSNKRGIAAVKAKMKQSFAFAGESAPGDAGALEETQTEDYLNEIELIPQEEEKGDGKRRS
jgi:predicted kinase